MVGEFVYTHMRMYTCLPYAYCSERMCAKDMCTGDGGRVSIRVYAHVYVLAVCVL